MSEVLQANLFFFITAFAIVIATFFICVALYYIIRILRVMDKIATRIDEKSSMLADDLTHIRAYIAQGGLMRTIGGIAARVMRRPRRRSTMSDDEPLSE